MIWQFNPYSIPLFLSGLFLFSLAAVVQQRSTTLPTRLFMIFMLSVAAFNIAYGLELLAADLPTMMIWLKAEYLFRFIPTLWLFFALAYTGYEKWLTRRNVLLALVIPALWTLLAWTNEYHHLNWASIGTQQVDGLLLFSRTYGVGFYVGIGYDYAVVVAAAFLMILSFLRYPATYKGQIAWLLMAIAFPLAGSALTTLRLTPIPNLDLLPFGFALICLPVSWSLFRHHLFDITLLAHSQVIRSMRDAVVVMDVSRRVLEMNPAAAALMGCADPDASIGLPLAEVFADQSENLNRLAEAEQPTARLVMTIDAEERYFEASVSPVHGRRGQQHGYVIVLRDITDYVRAEQTISHNAAELKAHNSELDSFSHTVAHDLKSPVTSVIGYSQFLLELGADTVNEELGQQYLLRINQSGHKMSQMIDGLLILAQLGQNEAPQTTVNMTVAARAALERFKMDIDERHIQIELESSLPSVSGQAIWLEEVFANLISNAIKYIGQNNLAPRIIIRGFQDGDSLRYEVEDNGLGVAEDSKSRLFEMFARFHRNEALGLGLGLSIVLRIVQRLGGRVGVDSKATGGSIFWFKLPSPSLPESSPVPEAEEPDVEAPHELQFFG
ncbi:MAG: PAS domain-containing protein [Anaerolineae bacterium]|nr:PAS domain-containing protein [Anaerolineae bacterium]